MKIFSFQSHFPVTVYGGPLLYSTNAPASADNYSPNRFILIIPVILRLHSYAISSDQLSRSHKSIVQPIHHAIHHLRNSTSIHRSPPSIGFNISPFSSSVSHLSLLPIRNDLHQQHQGIYRGAVGNDSPSIYSDSPRRSSNSGLL